MNIRICTLYVYLYIHKYLYIYIFGYIYISIGSLGIQKNKNYHLSVDRKKAAPGDYQTFTFSRLHKHPFWNLVMWNSSSTGRLLCRILFECFVSFKFFFTSWTKNGRISPERWRHLGHFVEVTEAPWASRFALKITGSPPKWMQQENNQNICSVPFHRQFSAIATSLPCHHLT